MHQKKVNAAVAALLQNTKGIFGPLPGLVDVHICWITQSLESIWYLGIVATLVCLQRLHVCQTSHHEIFMM
jgi:hypothetical protein